MLTAIAVVITGPTKGGLGAQTAIDLAQGKPGKILLLGRTESKVTPVIKEIKSISPSTKVHFVPLNLASFKSIRNAAAIINNSVSKIDVLINNAGVMAVKEYTLTEEGLEYQFGANHIGHFLLTRLLIPKIEAAGKGARVVNLKSMGHQMSEVRFDDINFNNGKDYNKWFAYGQSKTANILFTVALAKKLASKGALAFAVHPGGILETNLSNDVEKEEWEPVWQIFVGRGERAGSYYSLPSIIDGI
jgi:NAD(P)-dependent dehydrogenase (short-subunit alcohol dehydrogenase family)